MVLLCRGVAMMEQQQQPPHTSSTAAEEQPALSLATSPRNLVAEISQQTNNNH
jgi:hypothetical protein